MQHSFVTIILAGGKGTRMGSADRHKVCFEVCGKPVILRALSNYQLCGSTINIVVVGSRAENVMSTISRQFSGVIFAYQPEALGTGDAAMKAVEILERIKYSGEVFLNAGDKLIETNVICDLLNTHKKHNADITVSVIRKRENSSEGIIITNNKGEVIRIVEESERQRLIAINYLYTILTDRRRLSFDEINSLLKEKFSQKVSEVLFAELKRNGFEGIVDYEDFCRIFSEDELNGFLSIKGEKIPANEVPARFPLRNQSTYVFKAPVLYEVLPAIQKLRPGQEKYLTDIFTILSESRSKYRVVTYEVKNPEDLMSFNNPQELLQIEQVYRRKEGSVVIESSASRKYATSAEWLSAITNPSPTLKRQLTHIYGIDIPWETYKIILESFSKRFSADAPVIIVRAPGRINLMGRHVDHQGGMVNVMAINREVVFVASPRTDDTVILTNTRPDLFPEKRFRISELIANLDWEDWEKIVNGNRLQRMLQEARGDWTNYVAAAILRLEEQFRDRRLRGFNCIVGGNIPMGAGLSSSSALVVATAEIVAAINSLPISAKQLVSLCGEGEWYVGTRGGAADHAAIKLSRRGVVTQVKFFPFEIGVSAPFPQTHCLIICNSGIHAGKSAQAKNTFNEKVTTCHISKVLFKMMVPELADKIQHLRDINPENLGISFNQFIELLSRLPESISQKSVLSAFPAMNDDDREKLKKLFQTHDPPKAGYKVRNVILFEVSEIQRAKKCINLLKENKMSELGNLMKISHDGDRVALRSSCGKWTKKYHYNSLQTLKSLGNKDFSSFLQISGSYECSIPEIDRIVDIACGLHGVEGAQLAGAGLGGCAMVLAQKDFAADIVRTLRDNNIDADIFVPIGGACSLELI